MQYALIHKICSWSILKSRGGTLYRIAKRLYSLSKMRPYQKICQRLEGTKNVLDIGCGDGTLDVYLAKEGRIKIVGLDISPNGFGHAKKKALQDGVGGLVTCVKGNVYSMTFAKENEFDAVTLVYSFHHIEDPISALDEIKRVIKPGGKILIVECIAEDGEGVVCCRFSKGELTAILNEAGFLNAQVEILGNEEGHEFTLIAAVK